MAARWAVAAAAAARLAVVAGAASGLAWCEERGDAGRKGAQSQGDGEHVAPPPSRKSVISKLKSEEFDVLVIGGGATGAGVALDAVSRGLRVALVEREDFAAGTSSKSTKLLHGGVRYLEKAFTNLDWSQYELVQEALSERETVLSIAPHLSHQTPIMVPLYKWWQVPYFYVGLKVYEIIARLHRPFSSDVRSSYYLGRQEVLRKFPVLNDKGLVGAVVYFDGQFDDAGLNLAVAMTAASHGARIANHVQVTGLIKNDKGMLAGAHAEDRETGEKLDIRAKVVINATGAYCDAIRAADDPKSAPLVEPSAGIHLILPPYYTPPDMGLLNPQTSDGRVVFMLPWEGATLVGTTDTPAPLSFEPVADGAAIDFVLEELRKYLDPRVELTRADILSVWSGIRPLVRHAGEGSTQALVRSHLVTSSPSGLVTVTGGKWTTYRKMAADAVDAAALVSGQPRPPSGTEHMPLVGAARFHSLLFLQLMRQFKLDEDVARQLAHRYGDRAPLVAHAATLGGTQGAKRLHPRHPFLEAQIAYAVQHEYACTVVDILARRTRLAFVDSRAALEVVPRVVEILTKELGWSRGRAEKERKEAEAFIKTMIVD